MPEIKESNSSKHFKISILKSLIRVVGYGSLMLGNLYLSGGILVIAEGFGIVEEL